MRMTSTGTSGGVPGFASSGAVPYGDLATGINSLMTGQAQAPYIANLPGYLSMVAKRSSNIANDLSGNLPDDVVSQIIQAGAERGILTGSPGSANSNAAMLRALGLNSLALRQQGSQNLSQAIADTPVPQLFNPASLIVPTELGRQSLEAARAGGAGGASPRSGGITYNLPPPPMPTFAPMTPSAGPGIITAGRMGPLDTLGTPQSGGDWWTRDINDTSQWPMYASQSYWDSPEGLHNPNRPADEPMFDDYSDLYADEPVMGSGGGFDGLMDSFDTEQGFWDFFNDSSMWE